MLVRRFLHEQLHRDSVIPSQDVPEESYPIIEGKVRVFNSATAKFRAPSDISGVNGMRCEHIRATPSWRKGPSCYDCVLINSYPDVDGARGFEIAHVYLFFSFNYHMKEYQCVLIQWLSFVDTEPDEETGFWLVWRDVKDDGCPHLAVIHVDSIYRAVHLLPAHCNNRFVNREVTMHSSLDTFDLFFVNRFADHHAFESLS